MKQFMKRGFALLLAFVLVIGLCPQLTLTADSASYVANWGHRGETATSLSSAAVAFYTTGNTYEDFQKLSGSATLSSVPSSALYKELQAFMKENHDHTTNYQETRYLYMYTDCIGGDTSKLSTFYIGKLVDSAWDSGNTYNREHTWPQSKGAGKDTSPGSDLMALRPTNPSANSSRGNTPFGEKSGYLDPSVYFDSKNYPGMDKDVDVRGDCARAVLYTYVRWGLTGLNDVFESVDVLLKWMQEDPVDTWELGRNDSVQSITGTRNVFVDYPELAYLLFGRSVPAHMVSPSAGADDGHDMQTVSGQAPTCAAGGWADYTKCSQCGVTAGYQELPAVDHSYTTSDTGAEKVYTCTYGCGSTYKTFLVTFAVDVEGIAAPEAMECREGQSITLPTPPIPEGHTFRGWSADGAEVVTGSYSVTAPVTLTASYNAGYPVAGLTPGAVVEVDGVKYTVNENGAVLLPTSGSRMMTVFSYGQSSLEDPQGISVHQVYPTTMQVYSLSYSEEYGAYVANRVDALDNIMTYQGTSIRMTGNQGIRIFTAVPETKRAQLIDGSLLSGTALEGYKLVEYGTMFKWAKDTANLVYDPSVNNRSVAYGGGVDAIFSRQGGNIWFTGMLVNLKPELCGDELLLRPYMVLQNGAGETIVLHGGTLQRNIGYVAFQNKDFKPNQAAADFIWNIIRAVYGEDFQG